MSGHREQILRRGLALLALLHLLPLAFIVVTGSSPRHIHPQLPGFILAFAESPAVLPVALVGAAAAAVFGLGRRPAVSGAVALVCLAALAEAYAGLRGGHGHNVHFSGAPLTGWLFGLGAARLLGPSVAAGAAAEAGAVGALAACYVGSAFSKLYLSGAAWVDGTTLRSLVLTHHPVLGDGLLDLPARLVIGSPTLATALAGSVLLIEGGAFLLLAGGRWRRAWGLLLVSFHVGAWFLFHIAYVEAVAAVLLFIGPWTSGTAERAPVAPLLPGLRSLAAGCAAFVAVLWALPLTATWSNLQFRAEVDSRRPIEQHAPVLAPPPERPGWRGSPRAVGPFLPGLRLSAEHRVAELQAFGDHYEVLVVSDTGSVVLVLGDGAVRAGPRSGAMDDDAAAALVDVARGLLAATPLPPGPPPSAAPAP